MKYVAILLSLMFAAGTASAADFATLDADGDGAVTTEEATNDEKVSAGFADADADEDGKLTEEEFGTIQQ